MKDQKRIRDYSINIGELQCGKLNAITDVQGVRVGHSTVDNTKEIEYYYKQNLNCSKFLFKFIMLNEMLI